MRNVVAAPTNTLASGLFFPAFLLAGFLIAQSSLGDTPDGPSCAKAGPQSPRDIDRVAGSNPVQFSKTPPVADLKLCDLHFHKFAEHRSSGYPTPAGTGDHKGFACQGQKPRPVSTPEAATAEGCGKDGSGSLEPGDTVEVHWVFTTCDVEPKPKLESCFSSICINPQVRVEARVFYLTDQATGALDFADYSDPNDLELPPAQGFVEYLGSTTGPKFNDGTCSPLQATWNVGSTCSPLDIGSLNTWCDDNIFGENEAHGVRELVTSLELLSKID